MTKAERDSILFLASQTLEIIGPYRGVGFLCGKKDSLLKESEFERAKNTAYETLYFVVEYLKSVADLYEVKEETEKAKAEAEAKTKTAQKVNDTAEVFKKLRAKADVYNQEIEEKRKEDKVYAFWEKKDQENCNHNYKPVFCGMTDEVTGLRCDKCGKQTGLRGAS